MIHCRNSVWRPVRCLSDIAGDSKLEARGIAGIVVFAGMYIRTDSVIDMVYSGFDYLLEISIRR